MISVIIPALNEAPALPHTVAHTIRTAVGVPFEILVSDCDSKDGTTQAARPLRRVRVITGAKCRADALNRGAAAASGDVLVFLHADTLLPHGWADRVLGALARPGFVGGAFDLSFGPDPRANLLDRGCLKLVVMCNRVRFRWTWNFYGDQTIFVRRDVFERIGGFPDVRLMEDLRFCRAMKRMGRVAILQPPVVTSARRFVARGVVRQFLHDLTLLGLENCGVTPLRLWDVYNRLNHDGR